MRIHAGQFIHVAVMLLCMSSPVHAQDAVPLASVQIVNAPDVRSWPTTATITHIAVDPTNLRIDFTKRDGPTRWPDVRPAGWTGDIAYTVWLFVQVNGQWVGSGFIQMWHGRDGVGDAPSDFSTNWYYGTRWSPMQVHGPLTASDRIGLMVTTGNARHSEGPYGLHERSNLVIISGADTGDYLFSSPPPPPPPPPPPGLPDVPTPPVPTPPVADTDVRAILAALADIKAEVVAGRDENRTFFASITSVWRAIGVPFMKYVLPALAAFVAGRKL